MALGGYGRQELFPHSDVDLLFVAENGGTLEGFRERVAAMCRDLWDLGLRLGNTSRTLEECGRLNRENLEFSVSLLDARRLAGDSRLFTRLHDTVIPHLVARDGPDLVRDLIEMTSQRHAKSGHTIFHLEPNIKEAPGGLRDYHVARWLAVLRELEARRQWVAPEKVWPSAAADGARHGHEFLAATRAFLHYQNGRDDNLLTYELQDLAAAAGIGTEHRAGLPPADWMRHYFRHARGVSRLLARLLDDAAPRASLYGLFQDWRSRFSSPDFSVLRGRLYPRQPAAVLGDPSLLLGAFEFSARHGLDLSGEAERWVAESLPRVGGRLAAQPDLWSIFRRILAAPYAAEALRAMHHLGVLGALFPEFNAIDSLVVRDFYHRYTVDEHSFQTIETLNRLHPESRGAKDSPAERGLNGWEAKFGEIFRELEEPELLLLALLFHDVGKGLLPGDHVRGSLEALERVFERLALDTEDRDTVRFLVEHHLEMSATLMRRDIFDVETVRDFSGRVGTPERLKMLCLLTFADIRAVNPEALTPWKAEMLWQLYAATANYFSRSADADRLRADAEQTKRGHILALLPKARAPQELQAFLEGFPRRYLLTHTPEEIAAHLEMACRLTAEPVQVSVRRRDDHFEMTVITPDRPFLFASLTGTLAVWGMNILKADAFANAAGIVLDTFRFADLYRTLELNPSEHGRLRQSVADVVTGRASLPALLAGRVNRQAPARPKVRIATQVRFENPSSETSSSRRPTLVELITWDRPGLLYEVSSTMAELGFNIELALIDTEGQKVIDVFYLTWRGVPLDEPQRQTLRDSLLAKLGAATP